jgi:hypothetical protein
VTAIDQESADVVSLTMQRLHDEPLPEALPSQYFVLRFRPSVGDPPLFRSHSLFGTGLDGSLSDQREDRTERRRGCLCRDHVRVGDFLEVSSPRGTFLLQSGEGPVALISAGVGVTPVLAMLYALSLAHSTRPVLWLHAARDGRHFLSPPRFGNSSRAWRTAAARSVSAGRRSLTGSGPTLTRWAVFRGRRSIKSAWRQTPTFTSVARAASWRT